MLQLSTKTEKTAETIKKKTDTKSVASTSSSNTSSTMSDGVSDEVIAVIAAAVAAMSAADGKKYAVRSIKRTSRTNERPVWAMAGLHENTAAF